MSADPTAGHGPGLVGLGAAACVACCAGPIIGFLTAASVATFVSVALFGVAGLAVAVMAGLAYLRRRSSTTARVTPQPVPATLGRKPDA